MIKNDDNVLIALPAYNESAYVHDIVQCASAFGKSVLVFDDGSTDNTGEIAQSAGAAVIRHDTNMGYGSTVKHILDTARTGRSNVLVILDADSQHDPNDIPLLLKFIHLGYDVVIGWRNPHDVPLYRRIGGIVLSVFTRLLTHRIITDSQCGFRAYSRNAINKINIQETGMAVSSEIILEASRHKLRMIEVPISIRYTHDSSTQNPVYQGFYTLWRILVMMTRRRTTNH